MGDYFCSGFTVSVKFSQDTNTPVVLRPSDMKQVLQLHPPLLNNLSHFGVWTDKQTLLIIFPTVDEPNNVDFSELMINFIAHAGMQLDVFFCYV